MTPRGLNRARFRRVGKRPRRGHINRSWLGEFAQYAILERIIFDGAYIRECAYIREVVIPEINRAVLEDRVV